LRLLLEIKTLHDFSDSFNPSLILKNYEASLNYLVSALTPTGKIPWVGTTSAKDITSRVQRDLLKDQPFSIEEMLKKQSNTVHIYPGYGHAIFRGNHPNGLYLIFVASQNLPAG